MPIAQPVPLTRVAFAPYGGVVEVDGAPGRAANDGRALRHDQPVDLWHRAQARDARLALYAIEPSALPLTVDHLERHPASCQVFIPMTAARYLVVVADDAARGAPDMKTLRAFVATAAQGVCYAPGVWHYPLVSLDRPATFAMFMWAAPDEADDCEVYPLGQVVRVGA